eukprot:389330_1
MSLSTDRSTNLLTSSTIISHLNDNEIAEYTAPIPTHTTSPKLNKNEQADKTAYTTTNTNINSYNQQKPKMLLKVIGIGNLKFKNGTKRNNTKSIQYTTTPHKLKNHYGCEDKPG